MVLSLHTQILPSVVIPILYNLNKFTSLTSSNRSLSEASTRKRTSHYFNVFVLASTSNRNRFHNKRNDYTKQSEKEILPAHLYHML